MMSGISSWVSGICAATLIVAVISAVSPKNSAGRVCVMIAGVIVVVALVLPVINLRGISILDTGKNYERNLERRIDEAEEKVEKLKKDIIEEELASYVLNKAGVKAECCSVDIKVEEGVVVSAEVFAQSNEDLARVRRVLNEELLVLPEIKEMEIGEG